eukprot:757081-Hanusia_phi.AAC.2
MSREGGSGGVSRTSSKAKKACKEVSQWRWARTRTRTRTGRGEGGGGRQGFYKGMGWVIALLVAYPLENFFGRLQGSIYIYLPRRDSQISR